MLGGGGGTLWGLIPYILHPTQVSGELNAIGRKFFSRTGGLNIDCIDGLSWGDAGWRDASCKGGVLHIEV